MTTRWDTGGPARSNFPETYLVSGAATLGSTPVVTRGRGVTIAKTADGKYTLTLGKKVGRIVTAFFTHHQSTAQALNLVGDGDVDAANNAVSCMFLSSTTPTPPNTSDLLGFMIVVTRNKTSLT
jgi:hypothetical protein